MSETGNNGLLPASPKVRFHRVVILEWLDSGETQTGTNIKRSVKSSDETLPIELIKCTSKTDVIRSIRELAYKTNADDIPIIHIEAHGASADGKTASGLSSSREPLKANVLYWQELLPALAELNVATGFNLIVVAAACVSVQMLLDISSNEPLCFMLFFGFDKKVWHEDLEDSLVSLYIALLIERQGLADAFQTAEKATSGKAGFVLIQAINVINGVIETVIKETLYGDADGHAWVQKRAKQLNKRPLSKGEYYLYRLRFLPKGLASAMNRLLCIDQFPDNYKRFGIDLTARIAEEKARGEPRRHRRSTPRRR